MQEPIWIDEKAILSIHSRQLSEHGGGDGVRDAGLLESAINRAKNLYFYGNPAPSIEDMAAAYAFGIAKNHPFIDGNKRTALVACILFLNINDFDISVTMEDCYIIFLKLAEGMITEAELSAWISENIYDYSKILGHCHPGT